MKIGIKVGPEDGISVIQRSGATYAEVWFRADWVSKYRPLFAYMRRSNITFGLHFWGVVKNKYFPNLIYYPRDISQNTADLIRKTIDIAAKEGASYVNIHPESFRLVELDLNNQKSTLSPFEEADEKKGFQSLLFHCQKLNEYALNKQVKLYVETVPVAIPKDFQEGKKEEGRLNVVYCKGLNNTYLALLGKHGLSLCFDIGHVTGQYPNVSRTEIFKHLLYDAKLLAPYTKLIHVNTTVEPFNGTDSHNGILESDMKLNVFPTISQLKQTINMFDTNSILLIPEPQRNKMVENYHALRSLFQT